MVNKFQKFLEKSDLSKNTISSYVWTVEYFLKNRLKKEENQEWYFVVRYLAATGARVVVISFSTGLVKESLQEGLLSS